MTDQQQQQTTTEDLKAAAQAARAAAIKALRDRGITATGADVLVGSYQPVAVLAWCHWWDQQRGVEPGLLVQQIRSGQDPPKLPQRDSDAERQQRYLAGIIEWLTAKMPDVCRVDPRLVEACRSVYGDTEAQDLARDRWPHRAAISTMLAVPRTERPSVKRHGPRIREAVRKLTDRDLADFAALAAMRTTATQEDRP